MLFGRRLDRPKPLIMIGMAFLALAGVWPRFVELGLGPDWTDGVHGALYGMAFGALLWGARLGGLRRRRGT